MFNIVVSVGKYKFISNTWWQKTKPERKV